MKAASNTSAIIGLTLLSTLGLMVCNPAYSAQRYAYPFDDPQDLLTTAANFESWYAAVTAHQTTRELITQCANDKSACRGRLKSYNRMIERAAGLSADEQIELVNYYINRSRYDDDRWRRIHDEQGRRVGWLRNNWTSLYDFLIRGGDCEDYASSKYFMLRELGFSARDLRVVVARSRELGGMHAVLAVRRPDGTIWLLDSDNRVRKRSHYGYTFVYAMNEHHVWDHRDDYVGQQALSNAQGQVHNEASSAQGIPSP